MYAISGGVSLKLSGTMMTPVLPAAKSSSRNSGLLGKSAATRSPRVMPTEGSELASRLTLASNSALLYCRPSSSQTRNGLSGYILALILVHSPTFICGTSGSI